METPTNVNIIVHRYVNIPCPSGKHSRCVVTFRDHTVAAMCCIPCEVPWVEPTSRQELRDLGCWTNVPSSPW